VSYQCVIKKLALNNLHQAGPNKPIYDDAWKHKNQMLRCAMFNITAVYFLRPVVCSFVSVPYY